MASPLLAWTERRKFARLPSLSPLRIEWETPEGELMCARGMTRDVSPRCIFTYIEHPLSVGLEVAFDVSFSPQVVAGQKPALFHCWGRVLHCERFQNRFGAAISILSYQLIETRGEHQRSSERIIPPFTLVANIGGAPVEIIDLSDAGAFIADRHTLPVGSVIGLRLQAKEWPTSIEVKAVVRRVEPQIGIALEFVTSTTAAQRQLRALVQATAATMRTGVHRGTRIPSFHCT